jgi:hypothetical protein
MLDHKASGVRLQGVNFSKTVLVDRYYLGSDRRREKYNSLT